MPRDDATTPTETEGADASPTDNGFEPMTAALSGHIDKPLKELPPEIQDRIRRSGMGLLWDVFTPDRKLAEAKRSDWEDDPAHEADRYQLSFWQDEAPRRLDELEKGIAALKVPGPLNDDKRQDEIARLWEKHCAVEALLRGAESAEPSELHSALMRFRDPHVRGAVGEAVPRLEAKLAGTPAGAGRLDRLRRLPEVPVADAALTPIAVPAPVAVPKGNTRGPKPGTVLRFGAADAALFPEIETLMANGSMSGTAATQRLADNDKVAGNGTKENLAKRLHRAYQRHKKLDPTKSH